MQGSTHFPLSQVCQSQGQSPSLEHNEFPQQYPKHSSPFEQINGILWQGLLKQYTMLLSLHAEQSSEKSTLVPSALNPHATGSGCLKQYTVGQSFQVGLLVHCLGFIALVGQTCILLVVIFIHLPLQHLYPFLHRILAHLSLGIHFPLTHQYPIIHNFVQGLIILALTMSSPGGCEKLTQVKIKSRANLRFHISFNFFLILYENQKTSINYLNILITIKTDIILILIVQTILDQQMIIQGQHIPVFGLHL